MRFLVAAVDVQKNAFVVQVHGIMPGQPFDIVVVDRFKLLKSGTPGSDRCGRLCALLVREAQTLARISHPNVIGIHDVGDFGGCVYVAMEFIDGETLTTWGRPLATSRWTSIRTLALGVPVLVPCRTAQATSAARARKAVKLTAGNCRR